MASYLIVPYFSRSKPTQAQQLLPQGTLCVQSLQRFGSGAHRVICPQTWEIGIEQAWLFNYPLHKLPHRRRASNRSLRNRQWFRHVLVPESLQVKLDRLFQIRLRFLDCLPLADDAELHTVGDVPLLSLCDDRREPLDHLVLLKRTHPPAPLPAPARGFLRRSGRRLAALARPLARWRRLLPA